MSKQLITLRCKDYIYGEISTFYFRKSLIFLRLKNRNSYKFCAFAFSNKKSFLKFKQTHILKATFHSSIPEIFQQIIQYEHHPSTRDAHE